MSDTQLGALYVDLILDKDGKYAVALNRAHQSTKAAVQKMEAAMGKLKSFVAGIGIAAVVDQSVKAFQESEKAVAKLSAAIGGNASYNQKMVDSLTAVSDSIMKLTVLDDDAVTSAMAYAASLKAPVDKLGEYAVAAVGLSHKLRIELNPAMGLIIKASNGTVTQLQRSGISFNDCSTNSEKLAKVLKLGKAGFEEATRYAGSAAGRFEKFKVMIGEAAEKLGGALMPLLAAFMAMATPLLEWLSKIPTAVVGGILALGGVIYILANVKGWLSEIKTAYNAIVVAATAAKTAMGSWGTAAAVAGAVATVVLALKYASDQANDSTAALTAKLNNLGGFMDGITKSSDKATQAINEMKQAQTELPKDATSDPFKAEAEAIKDIIDKTQQATKAELDRRRAMIGSVQLEDISRKATEAGLRERFSTAIVNQGDVTKSMRGWDLSALRSGSVTQKQVDAAMVQRNQDKYKEDQTLLRIYNLIKTRYREDNYGNNWLGVSG